MYRGMISAVKKGHRLCGLQKQKSMGESILDRGLHLVIVCNVKNNLRPGKHQRNYRKLGHK